MRVRLGGGFEVAFWWVILDVFRILPATSRIEGVEKRLKRCKNGGRKRKVLRQEGQMYRPTKTSPRWTKPSSIKRTKRGMISWTLQWEEQHLQYGQTVGWYSPRATIKLCSFKIWKNDMIYISICSGTWAFSSNRKGGVPVPLFTLSLIDHFTRRGLF